MIYHRASGGSNAHRPSLWVENKQTKELIAEILKQNSCFDIGKGRSAQRYLCEQGLVHRAMLGKPRFHLTVIARLMPCRGTQVISRIDPEVEHAIERVALSVRSESGLLSLLGPPEADEDT